MCYRATHSRQQSTNFKVSPKGRVQDSLLSQEQVGPEPPSTMEKHGKDDRINGLRIKLSGKY
jgi:hypothetical protein